MKKIFILAVPLIIFSSHNYTYAGDAPISTTSNFELDGEVLFDSYFQSGTCFSVADPADVFEEELTIASIGSDLETIGFGSGKTLNDQATMTFDPDPCGGKDEKNINLGFSKIILSGSGQLDNGLLFSVKNTFDVDSEDFSPEFALEGGFGKLLLKEDTSAVDSMMKGTNGSGVKTAIDVIQDGHITTTSGNHDGFSVVYFTPSFGGIEMALGMNVNDNNLGQDNSNFDTYSIGMGYETYVGDVVLSLGGGIEKATNNSETLASCLTTDLQKAEDATDAASFYDGLYGGSSCGDEFLSAIGLDLMYDNYTISTAFTNADSENSDSSVWSVGVGTSVKDVDYTIGFTQESLKYARNKVDGSKVEDTSKIISLDATKPLSENIDLGLNFSNAQTDKMSQELGAGPESAWRAGVSFTLGF
jgi:hypothetical protein